MKEYKYFENVKRNAYFCEIPCQFCGGKSDCLDGVFFEKDEVESICLSCFEQKKARVYIPDYIQNKIKNKRTDKTEELFLTPPVPWIQYNEWPVCCDDYMKYLGEWDKEAFEKYFSDNDNIESMKNILSNDMMERIENFEVLLDDLGNGTAAFVFKCNHCDKVNVVFQDY
ncbi:MAG: CbrC family protein [Eubacterium sp.]|nr:CbrC family protein [Eubacterium sp.]